MSRTDFLLMRATFLASQQQPDPQPAAHPGLPLQGQGHAPAKDGSGLTGGSGGSDSSNTSSGKPAGRQGQQGQPQFVQHMLDCMDRDLPSFGPLRLLFLAPAQMSCVPACSASCLPNVPVLAAHLTHSCNAPSSALPCPALSPAPAVGLSIEMACCIVVLLVLSGLVDWVGPLFLAVGVVLLFATNTALVTILRHSCRGGRAHRASGRSKASAVCVAWLCCCC